MKIGMLSKKSGVGVEAIRFYERKGLIKKLPRPQKGFRQYTLEELNTLLFIKRCQELGFTLKEIKTILDMNSKPGNCTDVKKLARLKAEQVEAKIADLKKMLKVLKQVECACDNGKQALMACDINNCFAKGGTS